MWLTAVLYTAAVVTLFAVPREVNIGGYAVGLAIIATVHSVVLRQRVWDGTPAVRPTPAPAPPAADPAVAAVLAARARRDEARRIVSRDPAMARELGIGRPDLRRAYDDGGLVDLNNAPAQAIAGTAASTSSTPPPSPTRGPTASTSSPSTTSSRSPTSPSRSGSASATARSSSPADRPPLRCAHQGSITLAGGDRMLHMRVISPRGATDAVRTLLLAEVGATHVTVPRDRGPATGDVVEADVARESVDGLLGALCESASTATAG